jgi:hypothetical protein
VPAHAGLRDSVRQTQCMVPLIGELKAAKKYAEGRGIRGGVENAGDLRAFQGRAAIEAEY